MKIGIIGAGQIGNALTRRFTAVGHEVFVANSRGPETLAQLVAETGAHAVTAQEVARSGGHRCIGNPRPSIRLYELWSKEASSLTKKIRGGCSSLMKPWRSSCDPDFLSSGMDCNGVMVGFSTSAGTRRPRCSTGKCFIARYGGRRQPGGELAAIAPSNPNSR